jgi:spermidine/putrescine transport system permease protein
MSVATSASPKRASLFERLYTPGRGWLALPAIFFLLAVFIFPLVLIGLYSVNLLTNLFGVPTNFSLANWDNFLPPGDNVFWDRFKSSMVITLIVSVLAVVAAYPVAYFLAFVARRRRYTLLLLILAPFFTSYLLRVIAWKVILANNGVINSVIWQLGLREHGDGVTWLIYSWFAVALVLFYSWVPFVAVPIFVLLDRLDTNLLEAAQDLGAGRLTTFLRVTLPLSLPGVIAGFVFVLIPTTGEFITPLLVGGPGSQMFGNSIQAFFSDTPDWNYGSVLAIALVVVVVVLLAIFGRRISPDLTEEAAAA